MICYRVRQCVGERSRGCVILLLKTHSKVLLAIAATADCPASLLRSRVGAKMEDPVYTGGLVMRR